MERERAIDLMREGKMEFPAEVHAVLGELGGRGYEAWVAGGCLRDAMLARPPKDWDVATNASPEEIQKLFPDSFYENKFGTVGVKTGSQDPALALVEVTTFRRDIGYSDKRHPDHVEFAKTIEEDLSRRDFTINAMAHDGTRLADPFFGAQDLEQKQIRAVGDPSQRFSEDALRLMRGVRFATDLGFSIEDKTNTAMREHAGLLEFIAKERISDELKKTIMAQRPERGVEMLRETGLLKHVLPELEEGWGVTQNKHHIYTVWEHNVRALAYAAQQDYGFVVRLASLLHDVGKPRAKRGDGPDSTFYGHEVIGGRMALQMLERLRFPKHDIEKIALLVRAHMFNYDPDVVTDSSVRRLVAKVGTENIRELVEVREADRIGSGVKKAVPYKLRHFMFRVEKVLTEPVSRKQMKLNGDELMRELALQPGLRVGAILEALFEDVLDDPERNDKEALLVRAQKLNELSDAELIDLRKRAQGKYRRLLEEEEEALKGKYYI